LKAQVLETTSLAEALFVRERDLEPLDTPERRTGLKSRLRKAAAAIQDKELGFAYREDMLSRADALFGRPRGEGERAPSPPWSKRRTAWLPPREQMTAQQVLTPQPITDRTRALVGKGVELDPFHAALAWRRCWIRPAWTISSSSWKCSPTGLRP
jgi:DNA primase